MMKMNIKRGLTPLKVLFLEKITELELLKKLTYMIFGFELFVLGYGGLNAVMYL